jgi:hypothetical protein
MSNLLNRLAARTLGLMPSVQPKLTSIYESGQTAGDGMMKASSPGATTVAAPIDAVDSSSVVMSPRNLPTPLVAPARSSLAITRLSHPPSNSILPTAPDRTASRLTQQSTELNSAVASTEQNAPDVPIIATDLSQNQELEHTNIAANFPVLQPPIPPQESIATRSPQSSNDPIDRSTGQQTTHLSPELVDRSSLQPLVNPVNDSPPTNQSPSDRFNSTIDRHEGGQINNPSPELVDRSSLQPLVNPVNDSPRTNQSPRDRFNSTIDRHEGGQINNPSPELVDRSSLQPLVNPVNLAATRAHTPQSNLSAIVDRGNSIDPPRLDPLANRSTDLDRPSIVVPAVTNPPLNQPLSTNNRPPHQPIASLVPIVPRQIERRGDPSTREFQQRQNNTPSTSPTIQVKIGRIEIRVVTSPAPPHRSRPNPSAPQISLADYLKSRGGG